MWRTAPLPSLMGNLPPTPILLEQDRQAGLGLLTEETGQRPTRLLLMARKALLPKVVYLILHHVNNTYKLIFHPGQEGMSSFSPKGIKAVLDTSRKETAHLFAYCLVKFSLLTDLLTD